MKKKQTAEFSIGGVTGTRTRPAALLLGADGVPGRRSSVAVPLPAGWSIDMAEPQPLAYLPVEPLQVAKSKSIQLSTVHTAGNDTA